MQNKTIPSLIVALNEAHKLAHSARNAYATAEFTTDAMDTWHELDRRGATSNPEYAGLIDKADKGMLDQSEIAELMAIQ